MIDSSDEIMGPVFLDLSVLSLHISSRVASRCERVHEVRLPFCLGSISFYIAQPSTGNLTTVSPQRQLGSTARPPFIFVPVSAIEVFFPHPLVQQPP